MVWEKHVGRVGALAVALGIGSAVLATPGVVWAQSEDSAGVSNSSPADSDADKKSPTASETASETTDSSTTDSESPDGDASADDVESDDSESDDDALADDLQSEVSESDDEPALSESPTEGSSSGNDELDGAGHGDPSAGELDGQEFADPSDSDELSAEAQHPNEIDVDVSHPPSDASVADGGVAAVETDSTPDVKSPAADAEVPAADAGAASTDDPTPQQPARVAKSLSAPGVSSSNTDEPPAPASSPLVLTLLASAWRSLSERIEAAQSAAAVSSAAAVADEVQTTATTPIPGQAYQSPIITDDGTIYQVTHTGSTTVVSILDSEGQIVTTSEFDGVATPARATARPDGSLVVVTVSNGGWITTVRAVDSDGTTTRLSTVFGRAAGPLTVGADGALYFKTQLVPPPILPAVDYQFVRVSANNFTRTYSYDTEFELAADGTAHLVTSSWGFPTLRTIYSSGWTVTRLLPFGSDPSAPLMDQNGTVYVAAGVQGLFGTKSTRVYTIADGARTVRSITGLPGEIVMTADGFGLETFTFNGYTDDGTGTSYISTVTADSIVTSEAIDGRIEGLQVGSNGTAYAPIVDPTRDDTAVAVIDTDGEVVLVVVPGTLVVRDRGSVRGGSAQSADDFGYVNYTADGTEYVAVLAPDATVARTIELPAGAHGSVFFGPDGSAFELLEYFGPSVEEPARQILVLSTGAYTSVVPGSSAYGDADVVFGPDGVGYLITAVPGGYATNALGFDALGDTVTPLTTITVPAVGTDANGEDIVLVFGPDGTAYFVDRSEEGSGVYALTPSGAQKLVDLEYSQLGDPSLPTFGADGTGYVANTIRPDGGGFETTVTIFSPVMST